MRTAVWSWVLLAFYWPAWAQGAPEAELQQVIDQYEQLLRTADPITAAQQGDRAALARLPDASREFELSLGQQFRTLLLRLDKIPAASLSAESGLNHSILTHQLREAINGIEFDLSRIPFQNDSGFHTAADYLARTTTIVTREDAEAWLSRLAALPDFYAQNIANARRGVETRFTQPMIVVQRISAVAQAHANTAAQDSALLLPLARLPDSIAPEVQQQLRDRALALVRDRVLRSQRQFVRFMNDEYAPAARRNLAWRSVPNGESIYRFLVRRETTTDLTPEQVHALGQEEVKRIRSLMEALVEEVGFKGDFRAFLQMLRSDPHFYAKTPEDLLEKASEIAKRADDRLPALFGRLPRLPYGVRPVPAEIAEGYTTGRYWSGSLSLGQAGAFMVNTSKLDQRPLYELPALTLHEAAPGHHLQIALAQELDEAPYFRRVSAPTAFVEGWGLYAEFLGEEMGMYRDAYERFGRYSYEMWRACRLVADTGIHWLGWDIEQARTCFTENSALSPHNIQTELERYVSWPAQALAYKIGELRLRALRKRAEETLGERFNVRAFHDAVLLGGALPLQVLEARLTEWIREQVAG